MNENKSSLIGSAMENEKKLNEMENQTSEIQINNQESTINPYIPKDEEDIFEKPLFGDIDSSSTKEVTITNSVSSYDDAVLNEIDNIMGELSNLVSTIDGRDSDPCKTSQHKKKQPKSSMKNSKALKKNLKKTKNEIDSQTSINNSKEDSSELNTSRKLNTSAPPTIASMLTISIQSPVTFVTDSSQEMNSSLQIMGISPRKGESGITSMVSDGYEYQGTPKCCSEDISLMSPPRQSKEPGNRENYSNKNNPFISELKPRKTFALFGNRDASYTKSAECLKINEKANDISLVEPQTASIPEEYQSPQPAIAESPKEIKLNWFEKLKFSSISKRHSGNKVHTPELKSKVNKITHTLSFVNSWRITSSSPNMEEGRISKSQIMSKVYEKAIKLSNSYVKEKKSRKVEKNTMILKLNQMMWSDLSISDDAYAAILFKMDTCIFLTQLEELSELLSICCKLCPPSQEFLLQIETFLNNSLLLKFKDNEHFLATRDQILQMRSGIVSKGCPAPSVDFISQIRESIYNPSMFGISISDLMKLQAVRFPKLHIPWIIYILCNEIVARGGLEAEGMFRISGDTDLASKIRLKLNKYLSVPSEANAYDCASVLKAWCRELPVPLIPDDLYSKCLENFSDPTEICNIIRCLPEEEQDCICFLVKFIRIFLDPTVIDKTRMPIENLSMIWAPSFLRSPSSDPIGVAAAIGKEKSVTAIIITELNISSVKDVEINGKISIG